MAHLDRPDGVRIHTEERGTGPLVVMAPYWSGHPGVYDDMLSNLARDHRVLTFDARGTGDSTRRGPYDMETDCADLEAVTSAAGGGTVVISVADGCNRAVRVAAKRPDAIAAVVAFGVGPFAREHLSDSEAMLASDPVISAFIGMVERDYRGALRTMLTSTNVQMSDGELRERVAFQSAYCTQDAAAARVRAWADDDPTEAARSIGDRLWILTAPDVAGPWLPPPDVRKELVATLTPRAHVVETASGEGPISRPDLAAGVIRRIAAEHAE